MCLEILVTLPKHKMTQHCNLKDKSNDKENVVENQVKEGRLKQEGAKSEKYFS